MARTCFILITVILITLLAGCAEQIDRPTTTGTDRSSPPTTTGKVQAEEPASRYREISCYITTVEKTDGGYVVYLDEVVYLTGEEARKKAEESGRKLPQSGILIINPEIKIMMAEADDSVLVKLLDGKVSLKEWLTDYQTGQYEKVPFRVVMKEGKIIIIEEQPAP